MPTLTGGGVSDEGVSNEGVFVAARKPPPIDAAAAPERLTRLVDSPRSALFIATGRLSPGLMMMVYDDR